MKHAVFTEPLTLYVRIVNLSLTVSTNVLAAVSAKLLNFRS